MNTEWTFELQAKLIAEVRKHANLWDHGHSKYREKTARENSWEAISEAIGTPTREAENKYHILRSQFSRERRRIVMAREEGYNNVKSKWRWFESLMFLWDAMSTATHRGSSSQPISNNSATLSLDIIKLDNDLSNSSFENEVVVLHRLSDASGTSPPPSPTNHKPADDEPSSSRKRTSSDQQLFSNNKKLRADNGPITTLDEEEIKFGEMGELEEDFEIYGRYVASEMKNAKNLHATLKAKYFINNILIRMRLGKYNKSSTVN